MSPSGQDNYPTSLDLLLRIANALRTNALPPDMPAPRQQPDGSLENDVWVVVTDERPHFVQGLGSRDACERLARGPAPADWPATQRTATRSVYGPYPRATAGAYYAASSDRVVVVTHRHCQSQNRPRPGNAPPAHLHQVTRVNLTLTWADAGEERTTTYDFDEVTDAIFLTESALEFFVFPRYYASYGTAYVQALREELGVAGPQLPSSQS